MNSPEPSRKNLTGYRWHIDVMVIDLPAADRLRRFGALGWVHLGVADTLFTEVLRTKDESTKERLLNALTPYALAMGPLILDHSTLDRSILGSDDDQHTQMVYATIWPTNDMQRDAQMVSNNGRARYRDALHVATAIYHGASAFVTEDQGLWKAAPALAAAFDGFAIMSVADATAEATRGARAVRFRAQNAGCAEPPDLPNWPEFT